MFPFFSKYDAVSTFQKKFLSYTDNTWNEREFFQQKPGKYVIMSAEREKERLECAQANENELK